MRLSGLLPAGLLAFGIAAFALPSEAAYAFVFYVGVVPAVALCWRRMRFSAPGDWLALALIAWSGLTLLWGEGPPKRAFQFAVGAAATACFFVTLRRVLAEAKMRRLLAAFLVCAGAANAGLVLLLGAPSLLAGDRILGWGITRQPILGGSVMAVCFLTALAHALNNDLYSPLPPLRGRGLGEGVWKPARHAVQHHPLTKPSAPEEGGVGFVLACRPDNAWLWRGFCTFAAMLMAGFILAMQSRGALLGAAGGTVLLFMCGPWRWRAFAVLAALLAAWFLLAPLSLRAHALHLAVERGTSHRSEIWAHTLELIRQKPFFGHGLAANLPPSPTGFPHSLYLSLLFYGGMVGLLMFVGLAVGVTRRLARRPMVAEQAWLVAVWLNGLLAGITDFGQITKGPGPLWAIIWLPVALVLSLPGQATRSSVEPSRASHSVAARRCGESVSASAQNAAP